MFRRIYRQRRRILVAGFFTLLGVIFFLSEDLDVLLSASEGATWLIYLSFVLTAVVAALFAMALAALWITLFPNWRFLVEQSALIFILFSAFDALAPGRTEGFGALAPLAIFFVICSATYGNLLDRFPGWLRHGAVRRFRSDRSPDALWRGLVEEDGTMTIPIDEVQPVDGASDLERVKRSLGAGTFRLSTRRIIADEAPFRHAYRFEGDTSAANKPITSGSFEVRIDARPDGGADVMVTEIHDALLWRDGINMWLDDAVGSLVDHMSAMDRGKSDWSVEGIVRRRIIALA